MKSVLWILNGCGLEGRGITGAPVRFHEESRRFARMGIRQQVLTTSGGLAMIRALGSTVPAVVVPASFWLRREPCVPFRLWSYLVTVWRWRRYSRDLPKCDTVISVSDYFCDVIPARSLQHRWRARWIAWIHHCETEPKKRPGRRLVNELMYRLQRWSFRVIAGGADVAWINDTLAGDEIERRLRLVSMPPARIRRMWNGMDLAAIKAVTAVEKQFDAVMVGVRPNKGMFDIIPIWQAVERMRPGTSLLLIGGMSGERETLQEIDRLGLKISVHRPESGLMSSRDYYRELKSARILFAPSHEEGWGIAVGEAMAAGLPVVAYDLPAYRKIYPAAYAAVPCFDREDFARQVVKALDDSVHAGELCRRGLAVASRYDWDQIAAADAAAAFG